MTSVCVCRLLQQHWACRHDTLTASIDLESETFRGLVRFLRKWYPEEDKAELGWYLYNVLWSKVCQATTMSDPVKYRIR